MNILKSIEDRHRALSNKRADLGKEIERIDDELDALDKVYKYIYTNILPETFVSTFNKYIANIEPYCNWSKLPNGSDPDEEFMRLIESQIGISENAKKAFREEVLIRMSVYLRKGKEFTYESYDRLREAIEKFCRK